MLTNRFMTLPEPFDTVVREMDQVFDRVLPSRSTTTGRKAPVALWEDEEKVFLEIEVPGIAEEDLDVTVRDGQLIIAGERKTAKKSGKCWYNEHKYGRFERVIALSDMFETDSIDAELSGGILYLTLHKKPSARPHRISIKAAEGSPANGQPARLHAEAPTGDSTPRREA
jgi:HSP20 family protein